MSEQPRSRPRRALKAGGPPAAITAAIGVGATGVAGQGIEKQTDSVATGVARTVGLGDQLGPVLLVVISVLILVVAFLVPAIFEGNVT